MSRPAVRKAWCVLWVSTLEAWGGRKPPPIPQKNARAYSQKRVPRRYVWATSFGGPTSLGGERTYPPPGMWVQPHPPKGCLRLLSKTAWLGHEQVIRGQLPLGANSPGGGGGGTYPLPGMWLRPTRRVQMGAADFLCGRLAHRRRPTYEGGPTSQKGA